MSAARTTHKERQDAAIVASLQLLSAHPFNEVLTAEEERGLAASLGALRAWAESAGCIKKPLDDWSREEVLRFLALAVRAAVPLRMVPDHAAFREMNDEIPF